MQTSSTAGILGARIFLPGRETTVVDRREGHGGHGYYNDGRNTHTYGDACYRESGRANVGRRTVPKTHSQGEQATVYGQAAPYARLHTISLARRLSSKNNQNHIGDTQARQ